MWMMENQTELIYNDDVLLVSEIYVMNVLTCFDVLAVFFYYKIANTNKERLNVK